MDSKRKNNLLRAIVVLAAIGLLGWLIQSRLRGEARATPGKDGAPGDRVVPVVTASVVQRDMPLFLDGIGNALASATVTVRAQVEGRIDRIAFREGQDVKKGDLLAQIDPRPFQNQLHSAQAALARDRAQLAGARRNLERYESLAKDGLSSAQQVEDQRVTVAQLEATTRADQVSVDSARLQLDYARVTSPIDGVTGVRLVDQGNIVRPTDPNGIVMITAIDPMAVLFTLPQDDLARVGKQLAEGPIEVEAMSRDGLTKLATGELLLIDNQINQATATIRLKALFPNPERVLWPNQFVKTRLLLTVRKDALVIPAAVVQRGPQGTFAYVVGPDKKAVVRPIQTEATEGDLAVVTSGLSVGEEVVVDGQYQLRPGATVAPRAADAPATHGKGRNKDAGAHR